MTSNTEDASTPDASTYELDCTDCPFGTTVEGSFTEAFDVADSHQNQHGGAPSAHFVNIQLRDAE